MHGSDSAMRCEWPTLTEGTKCPACGYTLKRDYDSPPVRTCGAVPIMGIAMLIDYNIHGSRVTQSRMLRPPCQHLGAKRFLRSGEPQLAKLACGTESFTPIYECSVYTRATPFGRCKDGEADADFVHSCQSCDRYLKPYPVLAVINELINSP